MKGRAPLQVLTCQVIYLLCLLQDSNLRAVKARTFKALMSTSSIKQALKDFKDK